MFCQTSNRSRYHLLGSILQRNDGSRKVQQHGLFCLLQDPVVSSDVRRDEKGFSSIVAVQTDQILNPNAISSIRKHGTCRSVYFQQRNEHTTTRRYISSSLLRNRTTLSQPTELRNNNITGYLKKERYPYCKNLPQQQQYRSFEYLIDPKKISQQQNTRQSKKERKQRKVRSNKFNPANRFIDRIRIQVQGGIGGKGSLSSHQIMSKNFKLRPDGGHGGNGGCIYLVANDKTQSLRMSNQHYIAESGTNGTSQGRHGRNGRNTIIQVPTGVIVKRVLENNEQWDDVNKTVISVADDLDVEGDNDDDDNPDFNSEEEIDDNVTYEEYRDDSDQNGGIEYFEIYEDYDDDDSSGSNNDQSFGIIDDNELISSAGSVDTRTKVVLADLNESGAHVMVARGGRGGIGTIHYASRHGPLPDPSVLIQRAQPIPGEIAHLELELKLIADIGLVGFPNAGKSSLLRAISSASPVVAPYPFTTLHPILGCVDYRDGYRIKVADIPGLIDGASIGRGKGFEFLRHIERTKALLYIVDAAGTDLRDPINDLYVLCNELESYGDGSLLDRPALVVANKLDLFSATNVQQRDELLAKLAKTATEIGIQFNGTTIGISAGVTGEGLHTLTKELRNVVTSCDKDHDYNGSSNEIIDGGDSDNVQTYGQ